MTSVTAKVQCTVKHPEWAGATRLQFAPDYQDGRNAEWAEATPNLSLSMTVKDSVAEHFAQGQTYTLTFTPDAE